MRFAWLSGVVGCAVQCAALAQAPTTQPLASTSAITLKLDEASPREAYEKLAEQMHMTLDPSSAQVWRGREDARITASFEHAPYWEAFCGLADKLSAQPSWWENGTVALMRDDRGWINQPAVVVGPMRVSVQSGMSRHSILIAHTPVEENSASLSLQIDNEPNSPVVYLSEFKVPAATDRAGKRMNVELPPAREIKSFSRGRAILQIKLGSPSDNVQGIGKINLDFNAAVAQLQTIEVPDIKQAEKVARETPAATLLISFHQQATDDFSVELEAKPKAGESAAWDALVRALSGSNVQLLDASGKSIQSNGGSFGSSSRGVRRMVRYHPRAGSAGPPQKLIWIVPVSIRIAPVSVEFKDLLIP
jgi:hypothetical protein